MDTTQLNNVTLKDTGSLTNWMMSSGSKSFPVVGAGATEFGWTDRYAYEVLSVSADGKQCVIVRLDAKRTDTLGMTDSGQEYEYSINPKRKPETLYFKWNAWRRYQPDNWEHKYPKITIRFGIKDEYYEFSF